MVKNGEVIPLWFDPRWDGRTFGQPSKQVEGLPIAPYHEFYRKLKGTLPSGEKWETYLSLHHPERRDAAAVRAAARRAAAARSMRCGRRCFASGRTRITPPTPSRRMGYRAGIRRCARHQ